MQQVLSGIPSLTLCQHAVCSVSPTFYLGFSLSLSLSHQANQQFIAMPSSLEQCIYGPGDSWRVHPHHSPNQTFSFLIDFSQSLKDWSLSRVSVMGQASRTPPHASYVRGACFWATLPLLPGASLSSPWTVLALCSFPTCYISLLSFPSPHTYMVWSIFHTVLFPLLFTYFLCLWLIFKESGCTSKQCFFFLIIHTF